MEIAGKRADTSAVLLTYLGDKLGIWSAMAGASSTPCTTRATLWVL
jgi:hypothetical protein